MGRSSETGMGSLACAVMNTPDGRGSNRGTFLVRRVRPAAASA